MTNFHVSAQDRAAAPGLLGRLFGGRSREVKPLFASIVLIHTEFRFNLIILLQEAAEFDACDEVAFDHLQRSRFSPSSPTPFHISPFQMPLKCGLFSFVAHACARWAAVAVDHTSDVASSPFR